MFIKGCTFIVIFGLPGDKHEDDPARALKAGHRILDSLHQIMDITWVLDKIVCRDYVFYVMFARNRFQMEPIRDYFCTREEESPKRREIAELLTSIRQRTDERMNEWLHFSVNGTSLKKEIIGGTIYIFIYL